MQGLHYPEKMRPPRPLATLPDPLLQSTSFHTLEDLEQGAASSSSSSIEADNRSRTVAEGSGAYVAEGLGCVAGVGGRGHSGGSSRPSSTWGALDYAFLSPIYDSVSKQGTNALTAERGGTYLTWEASGATACTME